MRAGYIGGELARPATPRQWDVLAAYVAARGSVRDAAAAVGIRPSTVKRHLADLRVLGSHHRAADLRRTCGRLAHVPSLDTRATLARPSHGDFAGHGQRAIAICSSDRPA